MSLDAQPVSVLTLRKQGHERVMEDRGPPTVPQQGTSVPSLEPSFVPISVLRRFFSKALAALTSKHLLLCCGRGGGYRCIVGGQLTSSYSQGASHGNS